ncbi:MAG: hypothetical protein H0T89_22500 [Deltaproteobacteria bacterium]|nr:hypothetical protein [Deltaproteobacteria bacterium]MDQ3295213.1 hypothetical protein [Myxococcota bacterium]
MRLVLALVVAATIGALAGDARAYPQFQLSRDQTCTGCHLSPAGGNLLNENGLAVAESMSQFGTAPEFFYGKIPTPSWLVLGGDLRGAAGYLQTPEKVLAAFPMQIELYAAATFADHFSIHANFGPRPSTVGNEAATSVWSREHYLQWQQKAGENEGLYLRAGRFMPVIGLRLAEHPTYIRRYGGTQLYAETYGVAAEYVTAKYELHLTGFIKDPFIDPVEHYSGGAAYGEIRLSEKVAIGAEGMAEISKDDKRLRGGVTGKVYLEGADLLIQGEFQFVNQLIDETATNPAGGAPQGFVGYLLLSRMLGEAFLLDVGFGHYDPNRSVRTNERDCIDLNLHWFTTSHLELVLNSRYELIGLGDGGDAGAYAILQLHYRL